MGNVIICNWFFFGGDFMSSMVVSLVVIFIILGSYEVSLDVSNGIINVSSFIIIEVSIFLVLLFSFMMD